MPQVRFLEDASAIEAAVPAFRSLANATQSDLSFHQIDFSLLWFRHFHQREGKDFGALRGRNFYGAKSQLESMTLAVVEENGTLVGAAPLATFRIDIRGRKEPLRYLTFCADSVLVFYQDLLMHPDQREAHIEALINALAIRVREQGQVLFLGYIPEDSANLPALRQVFSQLKTQGFSGGETPSHIRPGAFPWNLPKAAKALRKAIRALSEGEGPAAQPKAIYLEFVTQITNLIAKLENQTSALLLFKATRLELERELEAMAQQLEGLPEGLESAAALRVSLQTQLIHYPRLTLPTTEEAYWAGLSKSRRYWFQRYQKAYDKAGGEFEDIAPENLTEGDIEDYLRLHAEHWGADSISVNEGTLNFHRDLCRDLAKQKAFHLFFARIHGKRIVAHACIEAGGRREYLFGGRSPEAEELRAGKLLVNHTVVDAVKRGFRSYDFGYGGDEYKTEFTREFRTVRNFFLTADASLLDLENVFPKMEHMVLEAP